MLDAALAGSRGWTAIIDATDHIRIGNGDRMGMLTKGDIGDSLYWKGDSEATGRVRTMLQAARAGTEQGASHMWTDPEDPTRIRFFELHARPIPDAENDEGLCLFQCVEVTDEREQAIRTAQAERMASIGELAGGLAHDFNNLLFVALGNLQLIERRAAAIEDEAICTWADRGVQAVQRGSEIAKALLTVSGRYPVNETVIALDDFIREMAALIEQSAGRDTKVEYRLEEGLEVRVDPGRLSSSILNLCVNARHAVEGRAAPTVSIELTRSSDPGAGMAEFAITDNGVGMSADVASRAFEPFFTTKPRGKGSGLGLASVFSFTGQAGGWTSINSTEGSGTTVRLALPLVNMESPSPHTEDGRVFLRALVVDDEVELARLVAAWLEADGISVTVAHDAIAAYRIIQEQALDLLVTDINLGDGDSGVEVAEALRLAHSEAKVVYMTAYADRVRTLEALGHTTLAKPFSAAELVSAIHSPTPG
jgi:signal transduction histidine kinase